MSYFGNAGFLWSATSDSNTQRVHQLNAPLRLLKPSENLLAFQADSLDRTVRDYWTVGAGAYELLGTVKYNSYHQSLVDLIRAGNQGLTLTYYPNLADAGTNYACKLISPTVPFDLGLDDQRGTGFGEHQVELRLRLTNQAAFSPLPAGTDVLFRYVAGDSLSQATFTRATSTSAPATYAAIGYGTLTTAKTNKARIDWISTNSSQGPRNRPVLLLEDTRTNAIKDSANFGTANWTITAGLTRSSAQSDPKGGTAAWRLKASTSAGSYLSQQVTVPTSGQQAVSLFANPSSNPSSGHVIGVTSSGAKRLDLRVSWSSGVPIVTAVVGKVWMNPSRYINGFYRLTGVSASSAAFASGKKITLRLFPTSTAASASKGTLAVYGAQIE